MSPLLLKLPIRLITPVGEYNLLIYSCLLCISLIGAAFGFFEDGGFHIPPPSGQIGLIGIGVFFALIALGGIIVTRLGRLPGSPYDHLEISHKGILEKSLFFAPKFFTWQELPEFKFVTSVRKRTEDGKEVVTESHYAVAQKIVSGQEPQDILHINANHYGKNHSLHDALTMVAWLNQLRTLARDSRLGVNEAIEVPENFRHSVIKTTSVKQEIAIKQMTPVIERNSQSSEKSVERP